ncbi:MAG: hypothetical protein M0Q13_04995 [Methanothrix sp.]|nr:hypothetical protein [Methanothrix sp.]
MENPHIKITTTASAYDKIGDITAEPGRTLLVVDVILEDNGYNDLLIAPGDFSVKINDAIYHHDIAWHNLKSIGRQYLTNELEISDSTQIRKNGEIYLQNGKIRKGSLLFENVPLEIKNYEFLWVLAKSFNTTIDGVHFGKGSSSSNKQQ